MKDGDVAGFSAFNGHSGILAITRDGNKKHLSMSTNFVDLDNRTKAVLSVDVGEKVKVEI